MKYLGYTWQEISRWKRSRWYIHTAASKKDCTEGQLRLRIPRSFMGLQNVGRQGHIRPTGFRTHSSKSVQESLLGSLSKVPMAGKKTEA